MYEFTNSYAWTTMERAYLEAPSYDEDDFEEIEEELEDEYEEDVERIELEGWWLE